MFEDLEDDEYMDEEAFADEEGAREESGNRTFVIAAIALGLLTIVAILCIGAYWFTQVRPANQASANQTAVALEQQTLEAQVVQQTVEASSWTATPSPTPEATNTPEATDVVVLPTATEEARPTDDPATATVAALLTEAAGQPTLDPSAVASITAIATELPDTGFFDDLDITGLIMLAFFALIVIFLARRMRTADR